ncbi:MAG: hypothetical protein P1U75_20315 [Antarcticimicrobium sp.]|uniref:hypothetical protein n=1 Tax=Antarcticimicrobium sp. TaxID=2824147 RepID=UPI00262573C6|nr:hypothetical protein [Antarcticimicrobium sp.]MDF1718984.1 hypothetical protein [Antarcticimicrobium sp.]
MASGKTNNTRLKQIVDTAEAYFGLKVLKVTAPGGKGRSSFRLHFRDGDMIATLRPNFRRTHLEAHVLHSLSRYCDDLPRCLGVVDEVMFQSDVGARRLNMEIVRHGAKGKADLAAEAVAAIFRIQAAARRTDLGEMMPHLGVNRDWIENFVDAVDALQPHSGGLSNRFDRAAACAAIDRPARQFVKWDCRSGNAALDSADKLRWFDFEYAGMRHGAEDFAWLIGDEAWPLPPETMLAVVTDAFDPGCGEDLDDYLDYLSIYTTFHCIQRFKLIVKEANKRGWLSKTKVRKFDDAGVHPDFAAQICRVGAYFAARTSLTAPLARNFEAAQRGFESLLRDQQTRKRA